MEDNEIDPNNPTLDQLDTILDVGRLTIEDALLPEFQRFMDDLILLSLVMTNNRGKEGDTIYLHSVIYNLLTSVSSTQEDDSIKIMMHEVSDALKRKGIVPTYKSYAYTVDPNKKGRTRPERDRTKERGGNNGGPKTNWN